MSHLLNSFSISNYIRQMMCGIIYFIPFFLFARCPSECFLSNDKGDWSSTKLLVIAAVAACVGTLIYHIEKNLLGYSSQVFRSWCKITCPKLPIWVSMVVMSGTILLLGVITFKYKENVEVNILEWSNIVLLGIFLILPIFLFSSALGANLTEQKDLEKTTGAFDKTVEETRNAWCAASVQHSKIDDSHQLCEIREISARESGWADFIHCGQTSAIAWILGSITAIHLTHEDYDLTLFLSGILISIWLLAFEFFCEWHKSLHVDCMIEKYKKNCNK